MRHNKCPIEADVTGPPINYSLAARIGQAMEPVLCSVGFNWQIDVALVPGMAAREVAVAALGGVYAIEGRRQRSRRARPDPDRALEPRHRLGSPRLDVFAPQCAATLSVVRRQTNSWKWTAFLFGYMLALAYLAAFVTYHTAVWLGAG